MLVDKAWNIDMNMQKHPVTKRIIMVMERFDLIHRIRRVLNKKRDAELRTTPSLEMEVSRLFFQNNAASVERILSILADDMSRQVFQALLDHRTNHSQIAKQYYSEKDQYLVKDIIHIEDEEVFIDGGGYTGDTIIKMLRAARKSNKHIRKIISFEPDQANLGFIRRIADKEKDTEIILIEKGLARQEGQLMFCERGVAARIVDIPEKADSIIPVINIDAVPECNEATFIKMDIEGAELDALKGAEQTILKNHPKLAICIYHSDADMLRIIEYVHQLVPEYRIYVRHHTDGRNETVMYAVI